MAKQARSAPGATPYRLPSVTEDESAAMMPATWVPCPLPRSVLETGPLSTGTTSVLEESGGTLAYSALTSVTLCLTRLARSAWVASQPESTTPTVTPLPVKPLFRRELAPAAVDDVAFEEAVSSSLIRSSG